MYIASTSSVVQFHSFPSGDHVHTYDPVPKNPGNVHSISWCKDGGWLAIVPENDASQIVSFKQQPKLLHSITSIGEPSAICFQNTTKKNVAVGTKNGHVLVYDIKASTIRKRFPRITSSVRHVEFTPKDGHVVAHDMDIHVFSTVTNNLSATFRMPKSNTTTALRTNVIKRNYLGAGGSNGMVCTWDIHTGTQLLTMNEHKAPVSCITFSSTNAELIVSSGLDRQIFFYNVASKKSILNVTLDNNVTAIDFAPDGLYFVTGSQNGKISLYDSRSIQTPVFSIQAHNHAVKQVAFQKVLDADTSIYSIQSEDNPQAETFKELLAISDNMLDLCAISTSQADLATTPKMRVPVDSFIAAMGLDSSIPGTSQEETYPLNLSNKLSSFGKNMELTTSTPNLKEPNDDEIKSQDVSFLPQESANTPNINQSTAATLMVKPDEIRSMFQDMFNELKQNFDYKLFGHSMSIRQVSLDILMFLTKHKIKSNDDTKVIWEGLLHIGSDLDYLIDRIENLEHEMDILKMNPHIS